jgi:hypothetical protein
MHDCVVGKAGGDALGIIGVGGGKVLGNRLWQRHRHGVTPLHQT